MKNIHVLPTPKPSRVFITKDEGLGFDNQMLSNTELDCQNQNIYITNDSEIKEGDWFLWKDTEEPYIFKCIGLTGTDSLQVENSLTKKIGTYHRNPKDSDYGDWYKCYSKKIILTTDQDLIKDGVQAIDDEFLEWFVKNPSCEYVEVSEDYFKPSNMVYGHDTEPYKIIIPKEEQKQHLIDMMKSDEDLGLYEEVKTKCYCGHTTYCDCGPEQELDILEVPMPIYKETLEEAAERYNSQFLNKEENKFSKEDFINGAKWQQEQDKKMYIELVDLLERLTTIYKEDCDLDIKYDKKRLEFIEQLKKNKL